MIPAVARMPPALLDPRVSWSTRRRWADRVALAARAAAALAPPPPRPGKPLAACGTQSARDRHRRKTETCAACRVVDGRTVPGPRRPRRPGTPPTPPPPREPRRDLAPCGTETARRRHRRRDELCAECGVTALGPAPPPVLAPCGSQGARTRHRKNGEACAVCDARKKKVDRSPCGTKDARARHRRNGETWCEACGGPTLLRPASAKPRTRRQ